MMEAQKAQPELRQPVTTVDEFHRHIGAAERLLERMREAHRGQFGALVADWDQVVTLRSSIRRLEQFLGEDETAYSPMPGGLEVTPERFVNTMLTLADSWTSRGFNQCADEIGLALHDLQQPEPTAATGQGAG